MIVYIAIIFFLLCFILIEKTLKVYYFRRMFFIILILISGLRYYVGSDYKLYKKLYESFPKDKFSEYLFNIFIIIFRYFNLNYQVLIFILSFITLSFIYIFFNKIDKEFFWVYSFLFIIDGYYFETFNIMRQYLGLSIFLLSMICHNKWTKYLCFYVAIGIHKSIFFLVIGSIVFNTKIYKKIRKKIILFFIILGALNIKFNLINYIYSLIYNLLPRSYQLYVYSIHDTESKIEGTGLGILFRIMIFCIIFYFSKNYFKNKSSTKNNLYLNFYFYGEILYLFSFTSLILRRVSTLFTFFSIVLLPNIFLRDNDARKKYIFIFIIIVKILLFIKFLNYELIKQYLIYQII